MNKKDKFRVALAGSYKAIFQKKTIAGKMGYLSEEMEVVANDVDYKNFSVKDILICNTKSKECNKGISMFLQKKYKKAYKIFVNDVDCIEYPEVLFCQALCLVLGKGVKKNIPLAIHKLTQGKEKSQCCKLLLSTFYIQGDVNLDTNLGTAYELITNAFDSENADIIQVNIKGEYYYFCGEYNFQNQNLELARKYFGLAAEHNFGLAYYMIGKMLWSEDKKEASLYYFDKAKKYGSYVPPKYYAEERDRIVEQDFDIFGRISEVRGAMQDIGEIVEIGTDKLDPHIIKAKLDENKAKQQISKIDNETNITKARRNQKKEKVKEIKQDIRNNNWKARDEREKAKRERSSKK